MVKDKLCISERRIKILDKLAYIRKATCCELAIEFGVSIKTINRDIDFLSRFAPIYTKKGNNGGIYMLPGYRSYEHYLSNEEECLLQQIIPYVNCDQQKIIAGIIAKFSRRSANY